jgi:hypothetical protein
MENNIIHLRYGAYQHLNLFRLPASKKRYKQNQLLFFDEWWNLMESSQFNWFSKITGLIAATVGSVYWGVRQIAKKIIYLHEKK